MIDETTQEIYDRAGLGQSVTLGTRPAVLVVDLSRGFTDPECAMGSDLTAVVEATNRVLHHRPRGDLPHHLHDHRLRGEPQGRLAVAPESPDPRGAPDRGQMGGD